MTPPIAPDLLILLIIDASGGRLHGKTLLQKRAFFLSQFFDLPAGFHAHFYGPYSPMIDATVGRLKALSLIEERSEGFGRADRVGFEWRRYEFALTEDGRKVLTAYELQSPEPIREVREYLQRMERAGDNGNYVNLSIAAKTFFILKRERKSMAREEIQEVAKRLGWNIEPRQIEEASEFLERMGLVSGRPVA
jgi:uncharacterized protein YwgA